MTREASIYTDTTATSPLVLTLSTSPGSAAQRIENKDLPPVIQIDETMYVEVKRYLAGGVEIWDCDPDTGAFNYREPQAVLYDLETFTPCGIHFGSPEPGVVQWAAVDGSKVAATAGTFVEAPAPADPTKDAEWVKADAVENFGDGVFSNVTFIHRVLTYGGQMPPSGDSGTTAVPYTALYIFWTPW